MQRFYRIARYLLSSIESKDVKVGLFSSFCDWTQGLSIQSNIVSLALTKETILPWAKTMKTLLWEATRYLHQSRVHPSSRLSLWMRPGLQLELPGELRELNVGLHLLVSFTGKRNIQLLIKS